MTIILSEQACDELWQAQELTVQSDPLDPLDVTYSCPPRLGAGMVPLDSTPGRVGGGNSQRPVTRSRD
jgi:hypothetical protein